MSLTRRNGPWHESLAFQAKKMEAEDRRNFKEWEGRPVRPQFFLWKRKERRIAVFQRWQQMRKARLARLKISYGAARFCVCDCGQHKLCTQKRCYDCHDMWHIVRKRIKKTSDKDVEKRYGRVYETPRLRHEIDRRSCRFEDSENLGSLHNGVRALEDDTGYDL